MSRLLLALLLLSFVSGNLSGGERQPLFQVDTVSGKPVRGQFSALSEKWELRLAGQEQALCVREWLSLRRVGVPLPPVSVETQLVLSSGDRLPVQGDEVHLIGERLSFSCPWLSAGKPARVSLSS